MPQRITAAIALLMMVSVLIARHTPGGVFDFISFGAMLCVIVCSIRKIGLREIYLLFVSVILAALIFLRLDTAADAIQSGLRQGAFLMAFILLLTFLYETALKSPSITACGQFMTRQPPGRRFVSLFFGSSVMSVLFNLGVISLLTPLIQSGVRASNPTDSLNSIRERRQLVAVQRGVAWGILWSPTALAPLTLLDLIPEIDRIRWISLGFAMAFVVMCIGWLEDRLRFRSLKRRPQKIASPPLRAIGFFMAAFCWLLLLAVLISELFDESIVYGLMLSCPIMMVGWLIAQQSGVRENAASNVVQSLKEIVFDKLPQTLAVSITLACAGFIGRAVAALVPAEQFADLVGMNSMPHFVFLSLIPLAILGASWMALSPIVAAVFLGSVFGGLASLPIDPTLLALSISSGWALAMTASPIVTLVLLMARMSGYSGTTLAFSWNTAFSTACYGFIVLSFWFLTAGR